jgi:glucose/arabinose dehydrogenase
MRASPLRFAFALLLVAVPAAMAASCGDDAETASSSGGTPSSTSDTVGSGGAGGDTGSGGDSGVGAGGGGGESSGSGGGAMGTLDCDPAEGALPALTLTPIASGFTRSVLAKAAPGDDSRLYVVEQGGVIRVIKDGVLLDQPFLDIDDLVAYSGNINDERGLLGLAFHPTFAASGRFFVHYSDQASGGDTVIAEYKRSAADPDVADPTGVVVLTQKQPEINHNGGSIEFSPTDGKLYIGLGDGGGAEDQHGATGNGQDLSTKLGKMLRIDVDALPYTIPVGNMSGANVAPEIWDYGLRNPWRFSFDACTGDLYVADVGQYLWEEINVEPAGQGNKNYGWRLVEGNHCFNPATDCDPAGDTVLPVAEYAHNPHCSVTGGYVYRGGAIPGLRGYYFYGDYCSGQIWVLKWAGGAASEPVALDLGSGLAITSFGQDNAGNVYVVDRATETVFRVDAM